MDKIIKNVVLLYTSGCPHIDSRAEIRAYLRRFLSDRHVIHLHPLLWQAILRLAILPSRPARIQRRLQQIAIDAQSPLAYHLKALTAKLNAQSEELLYRQVCAYSPPFIAEALQDIELTELKNVIVMPLFPQYSATTHLCCFEQAERFLSAGGFSHRTIQVRSYCRNPLYIEGICSAITQQASPSHDLILTFHALPIHYIKQGDSYQEECVLTFNTLKTRLVSAGWEANRIHMTYHSRFGPGRWLGPPLEDFVTYLGQTGVQEVTVCAPGFALDCLETLYDIGIACRRRFIGSGGRELHLVAGLNASAAQVSLIHEIAAQIVTSITEAKRGHEHD